MGGVNPFEISEAFPGKSVIGINNFNRETKIDGVGNFHSLDKRYVTIGAVHSGWFDNWQKALKQSKVLIQVQTPDYFTRNACIKEVSEIKKLHASGAIFHILALGVEMEPIAVIGNSSTTKIKLVKSGISSVHLKGSWKISDSQVLSIANCMNRRGC